MNKIGCVIGAMVSIFALVTYVYQAGIPTCFDSCIGCQNATEALLASAPGIICLMLFIIGLGTIFKSLNFGC